MICPTLDNPLVFEDLWFAVTAEPDEYWVEYKVYTIFGLPVNGAPPVYAKDCAPADGIKDADVFLHGRVKWDGCSDWYIDEQEDDSMIHSCSRDGLTRIGEVMARCWDMTKELCPKAAPDMFDG